MEDQNTPMGTPIEGLMIDLDDNTVTLATGEIIPVYQLVEVTPGHFLFMAGPTKAGTWVTGEFDDDYKEKMH